MLASSPEIGSDAMFAILKKAAQALSEIDKSSTDYTLATNAFQVAFNYLVHQGVSPAVIHQALGTYDSLEG